MKQTIYAIVAACCGMLATSGIVAWATAAPVKSVAEDVSAHLDTRIGAQLAAIKTRIAH
jgi:hypothetical protein